MATEVYRERAYYTQSRQEGRKREKECVRVYGGQHTAAVHSTTVIAAATTASKPRGCCCSASSTVLPEIFILKWQVAPPYLRVVSKKCYIWQHWSSTTPPSASVFNAVANGECGGLSSVAILRPPRDVSEQNISRRRRKAKSLRFSRYHFEAEVAAVVIVTNQIFVGGRF